MAKSLQILVLQHPKEAKNPLNTVPTLLKALPQAIHRIGLSWRSLNHVLQVKESDPSTWVVLFLGTKKQNEKWAKMKYALTDKNNDLIKPDRIKGLILMDGTWEQSKTLWWRNPWLLKVNRIALNEVPPSRYGKLRKEPRKNSLSTIEAAGVVLSILGHSDLAGDVEKAFEAFLAEHQ